MIRSLKSQKVWGAFALFTTATFTATSAGAQDRPDLPPLPPAYDPGAPPTAAQPMFPPPSGPPRKRETTAEVAFAPDEPTLKLFTLSEEVLGENVGDPRYVPGHPAIYSPICDGPCATRLEPDAYRLALAKGGRPPVPVSEPVVVSGPSTLRSHYTDRSGWRIAGGLTGFAGAIGGAVMIVAARRNEEVCNATGPCFSRVTLNGPLMGGALIVLIVATTAGLVLMSQHDEATITVEPLTLGGGVPSREAPSARLDATPAQGAALTLRF